MCTYLAVSTVPVPCIKWNKRKGTGHKWAVLLFCCTEFGTAYRHDLWEFDLETDASEPHNEKPFMICGEISRKYSRKCQIFTKYPKKCKGFHVHVDFSEHQWLSTMHSFKLGFGLGPSADAASGFEAQLFAKTVSVLPLSYQPNYEMHLSQEDETAMPLLHV